MALAVSGLRRVEGLWLEARALGDDYQRHLTSSTGPDRPDYRITVGEQVETRVQQLTLDYAERIDALADNADDVLAVDPGVRRARAVVVDELRGVARDSRVAAGRSAFTLGPFPYAAAVEPALASARSRWRLDPGRAPVPAPLVAVARARETPPLHTEPTGVRLLTYAGGRLLEIDIDGGVVEERGVATVAVAAGNELIVLDDGHAKVRDRAGRDRTLGEAVGMVSDSDDPLSVWLATDPDGADEMEGEPVRIVRRVRLDGTVDVAARRVGGYIKAAAGRWFAVTTDTDGFVVHDIERPAFRFRRAAGVVHGLGAGTLLWTDHTTESRPRTLHVRDLAGGVDRQVAAPVPGATVLTAALTPGNDTLAVAWRLPEALRPRRDPPGLADGPDGVWLYDLATLHARPTPLRVGPYTPTVSWSRDGRWLFALRQVGSVQHSTIEAWRVGSEAAEPLAIEGQFHSLTAL